MQQEHDTGEGYTEVIARTEVTTEVAPTKPEQQKGYPLLDNPLILLVVRERRLELPYPKVPDPKSGASANSATLA